MKRQISCAAVAAFTVFSSVMVCTQDQTDADKKATEVVRGIAHNIENCSSADEVAEFKGKWVKVSWGPPKDVQYDMEKTASLLTPYKGVITFSIPYAGGQQQKTKQDAQEDKNLTVLFVSPVRYVLRIATDSSIKGDSKEIMNTNAGGTWSVYNPVRPERFCWLTVIH